MDTKYIFAHYRSLVLKATSAELLWSHASSSSLLPTDLRYLAGEQPTSQEVALCGACIPEANACAELQAELDLESQALRPGQQSDPNYAWGAHFTHDIPAPCLRRLHRTPCTGSRRVEGGKEYQEQG